MTKPTLSLPPPDQIPSPVGKGSRLWGSKGSLTRGVSSGRECRGGMSIFSLQSQKGSMWRTLVKVLSSSLAASPSGENCFS